MAVLLCLALVMPIMAACKSEENKTDSNNTEAEADGDPDNSGGAEAADEDKPDIPVVDMGGRTFTMLTYTGWGGESGAEDVRAEELTGDPINDAAFNRRVKIEQTYNCKIKVVDGEDHVETVKKYQNSILAGDGAYDFAMTACTNFTSLLTGNFLADFKNLTYIDMDKPYWDKNFYDSMALIGKNYAASGDISKRRLQCVWIMAFNKSMIAENALESPYDLVKNGQWTYDKMHEMAKKVAKDLNGDGKMDETDLWGLNYTGDTIMGIINSSGVKIAEVNSDGIPELTIGTEANVEKLMRIYTDMRNDEYSIDTLFRFWLNDTYIFSENRCLFLACATHNIGAAEGETSLRSMDVDFGIIPYPKWSLAQDQYVPYTAGNYHPVISVPQTNHDLENTGIILEFMAYEGMKTLKPAFYESLLKTKTARDEESADMIDYIFGNLSYDVGNMYNFGGITGMFGYTMSTEVRRNIVSTIEKESGKWQRAIDTLIAEIEKAD